MGTKVGPQKWLECNRELWAGLLSPAHVAKITALGDEEPWSSAKAELLSLIDSSNLGSRLFGWIAKELSGEEMHGIIKKQVSKMLACPSVGHKEVADVMMETMQLLEAVPGLHDLPDKRQIVVVYRGWKTHRVVRSIQEEVELNLVAAARGQAAACGALMALPGERELCGPCGEKEVAKIKDSYVKHSQNARQYVENLTKSNECKSGEQLLDLVGHPGGGSGGL